ncbi:hypothetical protein [Pseudomonas sp.]|uniref:hypothetical protein n=1 Tax=Pseudomonas sp. TaxID=306 RepID=UPI0029062675|nr:hypothetical protein [Pseudomonas sp.]MDU4254582.1 hypothetical protein [Pseudomonas sp.]
MEFLGLKLRTPGIHDLPMLVVVLALSIAAYVLSMRLFGWDIGQASAILFAGAGGALAAAFGIDVRKDGLRGALATLLFMVVLVALAIVVMPASK